MAGHVSSAPSATAAPATPHLRPFTRAAKPSTAPLLRPLLWRSEPTSSVTVSLGPAQHGRENQRRLPVGPCTAFLMGDATASACISKKDCTSWLRQCQSIATDTAVANG